MKVALSFLELDGAPGAVDIVNVYRLEQEHPDIISKHVLPLSAKVLWLHRLLHLKRRTYLRLIMDLLLSRVSQLLM